MAGLNVKVLEDGSGGAYVIVEGVDLGETFSPSETWIGFQIVWSCPEPDVYPHFIDASLRYVGTGATPNQHIDGNLPTTMARSGVMPGFDLPAIVVSRRSNRHNPDTDTPLTKLLRVLTFLRSR